MTDTEYEPQTGHVHDYRMQCRCGLLARDAEIEALRAALTALDEPVQWLRNNYPKAFVEMPTDLFSRFAKVAALLAKADSE